MIDGAGAVSVTSTTAIEVQFFMSNPGGIVTEDLSVQLQEGTGHGPLRVDKRPMSAQDNRTAF